MRIGRILALAGLVPLLLVAPAVTASAATVRVTGTTTETSPGTCSELVFTGRIGTILCEGLVEDWDGGIEGTGVFNEERTLNFASGQLLIRGTETVDACVGVNCGTLESTFQASGKLDLQTFEFFLTGEQHFTGGTGDLTGARGSVMFSLPIGADSATYEGFIVL
jgi:hypothetical protein